MFLRELIRDNIKSKKLENRLNGFKKVIGIFIFVLSKE